MTKKGYRGITTKVKTAKGRKKSSTKWLQRQLNDPYVAMAQKDNYRSRAAYKLIDLNDKFKFLKKDAKVIDLGAAPGGWTQVALEHIGVNGKVIAVDLLPMDVSGCVFIQGDFLDPETSEKILAEMPEKADIVMSDMAHNTTGDKGTDHLRIMALVEEAYHFALGHLAENGTFIAKVFQGGTEKTLLQEIKQHFHTVKHAKPASSRPDSKESYLVAVGFRG